MIRTVICDPFHVVGNVDFTNWLRYLSPSTISVSGLNFSHDIILTLYHKANANVIGSLKKAESVVITTDGWT